MRKFAPIMALGAAALTAAPAQAAHLDVTVFADLVELNDSGVSGRVTLNYDASSTQLNVIADIIGLEANQAHAQHIHGLFDAFDPATNTVGNPINSVNPDIGDDADGDGFLEVLEGLPDYGPVILPLTDPPVDTDQSPAIAPGSVPVADASGEIHYNVTYDLSDPDIFYGPILDFGYGERTGPDLLFPLFFREFVIHGLTVDGSAGTGTPGEVDGTAGYKALLPVATGVFVPTPAAAGLGLSLLVLAAARRSRSA